MGPSPRLQCFKRGSVKTSPPFCPLVNSLAQLNSRISLTLHSALCTPRFSLHPSLQRAGVSSSEAEVLRKRLGANERAGEGVAEEAAAARAEKVEMAARAEQVRVDRDGWGLMGWE